jgi:hypothetical protein
MQRKITRLALALGSRYMGLLFERLLSFASRVLSAALPRLRPEPARKARLLRMLGVMGIFIV